MLVENQYISVVWNRVNKKYYTNKGYIFTAYGDEFYVKAEDLTKSSHEKVRVVCDCCSNEYEMLYVSYWKIINSQDRKITCRKCSAIKISESKFETRQSDTYKKIQSICNERGYVLITQQEEIINQQTEIHYICPKHGETHTKATSLLQGKHCYQCSRETASTKRSITTLPARQNSLFIRAQNAARKKNYKLISHKNVIERNSSYIEYECPKHGVHSMRVCNLIEGKGCPECVGERNSKNFRLSPDEVQSRISQYGGILLNKEDYINQDKKNLQVVCSECSEVFTTSLFNFTQHGGQVCAACANMRSRGERKISRYLKKYNIEFEQEKTFSDCCDRRELPFDFYLPAYNMCIEYDGEQHFEQSPYFKARLEYVQTHDEIKTNYCANRGILLLRIPYWDYNNVENILAEKLNLHEDIV